MAQKMSALQDAMKDPTVQQQMAEMQAAMQNKGLQERMAKLKAFFCSCVYANIRPLAASLWLKGKADCAGRP